MVFCVLWRIYLYSKYEAQEVGVSQTLTLLTFGISHFIFSYKNFEIISELGDTLSNSGRVLISVWSKYLTISFTFFFSTLKSIKIFDLSSSIP